MENSVSTRSGPALPTASAVVELLKPITWFPPMWAFGCGIVSSGAPILSQWHLLLFGMALSGPLVCGTSQAVNDWYDRHVDAINEPNRPIPSGRVPGRWGLYIAIIWSDPVRLRRCPDRTGRVLAAAIFGTGHGLGLQRAAVAAEAQRLVGKQRCRPLLRRAAVVHRCSGHAWRRSDWRIILIALLYSHRRAWHHDAQ